MWQQSGLVYLLQCMSGARSLVGTFVVPLKEALAGDEGAKIWDAEKVSTFGGIAFARLTYAVSPFIDVDGKGKAESNTLEWVRPADGTAENIVAIALVVEQLGGAMELLWYDDDFPAVIMEHEGDSFHRALTFGDDNLVVIP